jgi:TniQ
MAVERRRLPLQVKPLDGEAIDSWLEATALAMGLTVGALAAAGELHTIQTPLWITRLRPNEALALGAATGLPTSSLKSMTLSHYDGFALSLDPKTHALASDFPFGPLSFSRFCPACIRQTVGRWRLTWRLGLSFACLDHSCLLVDVCPQCAPYLVSGHWLSGLV